MSHNKHVKVIYLDGTSEEFSYADSVYVIDGLLSIYWDYERQPAQLIPLTSIKRWEQR